MIPQEPGTKYRDSGLEKGITQMYEGILESPNKDDILANLQLVDGVFEKLDHLEEHYWEGEHFDTSYRSRVLLNTIDEDTLINLVLDQYVEEDRKKVEKVLSGPLKKVIFREYGEHLRVLYGTGGDNLAMSDWMEMDLISLPPYSRSTSLEKTLKEVVAGESINAFCKVDAFKKQSESKIQNFFQKFPDKIKKFTLKGSFTQIENKIDGILQSLPRSIVDLYLDGFFEESQGEEDKQFLKNIPVHVKRVTYSGMYDDDISLGLPMIHNGVEELCIDLTGMANEKALLEYVSIIHNIPKGVRYLELPKLSVEKMMEYDWFKNQTISAIQNLSPSVRVLDITFDELKSDYIPILRLLLNSIPSTVKTLCLSEIYSNIIYEDFFSFDFLPKNITGLSIEFGNRSSNFNSIDDVEIFLQRLPSHIKTVYFTNINKYWLNHFEHPERSKKMKALEKKYGISIPCIG